MSILDEIYRKAKNDPKKVAFPEAVNEKMMQAAYETGKEGYIRPVLVGDAAKIREAAKSAAMRKVFLRLWISVKKHIKNR